MLFFSGSAPNLTNVIPAMDHLNKFLTNSSQSPKLNYSMCIAYELVKKTLNNYYSHTDMSKTYWIAMGMLIDTTGVSAAVATVLLSLFA